MPTLLPDYREASFQLHEILKRNHFPDRPTRLLINSKEAAKILADFLDVALALPKAWLNGGFNTHPLTQTNFLRIIHEYKGKNGLKTNDDIIHFAISLYGQDYQRAISLVEIWPEDIDTKELDFRQKLHGLIAHKNADSTTIESVAAYFGSNWKAMSIAINMVESEIVDWKSLLKKLQHHAFTEEGKDIDLILDGIVKIMLSCLSPIENLIFAKTGTLPLLAYYDVAIFRALWELPTEDVLEYLRLFQKLGLVTKTANQTWEIDKDTLNVAGQYFLKLSEREQHQTKGWAKRRLQTDNFHKTLRKRVVVSFSDFPKITDLKELRRQRKALDINNFVGIGLYKRALKNLVNLGYYDSDWETLQIFTALMRPIDYLTAYYLRSLWTVYLLCAGVIATSLILFLWAFPFLGWVGIFLFFISIFIAVLKMYKIEEQWVGLWKIIVPKIIKQRDEEKDV